MEMTAAVAALSALAQESRLSVFRLLVQQGPQGLPSGEIAARLDVPAATMSFHLKELLRAGLIVSRRDGRSIIYALDTGGISGLMAFLTEDCCQGRPELCLPGCCEADTSKRKSPRRSA